MINIDISRVPLELQDDDFHSHIEQISSWFNSSKTFTTKEKAVICLHEGTHLLYTRMCGFEPKLRGPSIEYDPEAEWFNRSDGAVESPPFSIKMSADPVLMAKQYMGPVYIEERLLSHRTKEEIWASSSVGPGCDLELFNRWAAQRQELRGDYYSALFPKGSFILPDEIYKDCRSPEFRKKLWATAKEFESRVFGESKSDKPMMN